jgi:hypothetical protein
VISASPENVCLARLVLAYNAAVRVIDLDDEAAIVVINLKTHKWSVRNQTESAAEIIFEPVELNPEPTKGDKLMPISMLFWFLFIIWVLFGGWGYYDAGNARWWRPFGAHLLLGILIFLLGWGLYGFLVTGGAHR